MATVINNPSSRETGGDSVAAIIISVIVAILLITLFIVYGLPAIRQAQNPTQESSGVNVNIQTPITPSPQPTSNPAPSSY